MKTLREYIKEAGEQGTALGHFNISNMEALHGIYGAAKGLGVPVVIGVTEGEEPFFGREEAVAVIRAIRERDDYPIFLNADHHKSFESVKACVDAGFDMVIIDGAKLSFEENVKVTKQCVEYVKEYNKKNNTDVLVEGELGFIGESSKMLDKLPDGVSEETMTKPEDAKSFVEATGVDLLAPSVGNVHGMVKSGNPRLHPDRVKDVRQECGVPLVLHGGSGSTDEEFTACIGVGVDMVHINTEIRVAFRDALEQSLKDNPDDIAPYKYLPPAVQAIEKVVEARLKLFSGMK
jgi:fructose-bisphosphate aldolase, class II